MAIEPHMLPHFQRAASAHELIVQTDDLILLRVDVDAEAGDLVHADT